MQNDGLSVSVSEIEKLFYEICEIDRTRYNRVWDPQPPLVGGKCLRHRFSCLVTAHGLVMPCVGLNVPLGSIREKKLKDILDESEIIQDLRKFRGRIKGPCGTCEKAGDCYGCRGAAYQLTGDYLASDPLCWKNAPHVHTIAKLPVAVDGFIPQQPPLRVVDRLLKVGDRNVEVEAVVRPDSPFVGADGVLEEAAFLEIIAQATAAMGGFKHYGGSGRRDEGMLLGAKPLEVLGRARVGDVLTVSVFKSAQYGDFGIVRGTVHRGTDLLAQGEVKIWHHLSEEALHA